MIRALLVDDEAPARERLRALLADHPDVRIIGEASDGEEAVQKIAAFRPDLVFLDIQMPGRTGMEVVACLEPPRPKIIFCTAFDQYAIDAFELHAVDYLLKPINRRRLAKAVERVGAPDSEELRQEVEFASQAQARLLPQSLPRLASLDYSGTCRPARGVGGDFYDFLPVGDNSLGIALADVSGKGLFAGLLMASLQARLQSIAPQHGAALEELAAELNRVMYSSTETTRYATLFYGIYHEATKLLTYVNAGHTPPLILRPEKSPMAPSWRRLRLETSGTVIGLLPQAVYARREVVLASGDILLIFTDGLVEATNSADEEFGEERLVALAERHAELPAPELRDLIIGEVTAFAGSVPQGDDITLVVARQI